MKKMKNVLQKIFESIGILGIMSVGEKQYAADIITQQMK